MEIKKISDQFSILVSNDENKNYCLPFKAIMRREPVVCQSTFLEVVISDFLPILKYYTKDYISPWYFDLAAIIRVHRTNYTSSGALDKGDSLVTIQCKHEETSTSNGHLRKSDTSFNSTCFEVRRFLSLIINPVVFTALD